MSRDPGSSDWSAASSAGPRPRRNGARIATAIVIGVLLVAAAAGAVIFLELRGTGDVLARMVPEEADVYVTAYLDPSAGQKLNLQRVASKFPAVRAGLGATVQDLVDQGLGQLGLSYERDIRPWLGSQVALAGTLSQPEEPQGTISANAQPPFALLAKSKDDGSALDTLGRIRDLAQAGAGATFSTESHGGIDITVASLPDRTRAAYGLVDHTVVVANDPDFLNRIVDTDQGLGDDLAESAAYTATVDPLPDGVLGLLYVDPRALFSSIAGTSVVCEAAGAIPAPTAATLAPSPSPPVCETQPAPSPPPGLAAFQGIGLSLSAEPGGLAMDMSISVDPSQIPEGVRRYLTQQPEPNSLLDAVPGDAYGFLAVSGVQEAARSALQQAASQVPRVGSLADRLGASEALDHLTGDLALEAGPGTLGDFPSGALLVGTDDDAVMQRFLDRVAQFALRQSGPAEGQVSFQTKTYRGVRIAFLPVPELAQEGVEPAYAVSDGVAIVGSSVDAVEAVIDSRQGGGSIVGSQNYRDASAEVSEQANALLFLDVERIVQAVRAALSPEDRQEFDAGVAPQLAPVRALIASTTGRENGASARIFVVIR